MENTEQITPEQLEKFEYNRIHSPNVLNFRENGVSYPIPDLIGSTRLIAIDEDTVGAKEITFGYSEFAPRGSVHKPHAHNDCEEVMYILKGRGISGLNGEEFLAKEGDILFIPKGAQHFFYNPFDEPCGFIFIYTKGSLRKAGYRIESRGMEEIGGSIEQQQRAGNNAFDQS